jgi:hypothetical protein
MHRLRENFCRGGSFFVLAAFVVLHITEGNAAGDKTKLVTGSLPTEQEEISAETKTAVPHLQVYRDPQTGRFGPPPPGVAQMGQTDIERGMVSRSDQGLRPITLPDGAVAVDLQGRYRNMAVARIGIDGKPAVDCVLTSEQASRSMHAGEQETSGQGK